MKKFFIKFKKLVEGKYFSNFESVFKWGGLEVADNRKYVPWDSYRYINWKLTAKHDELFVDLFHQEREIELDVFFDINYNWKWWIDMPNWEIISEYFSDMIVYCRKNGISLKVFYPERNKINKVHIGKDMTIAYKFIDTIWRLTKKILLPKYHSNLSEFLAQAKNMQKRRAIVIFSDFLDLSNNDKNLLNWFDQEHALYLMRIPINTLEGQNYNSYLVDLEQEYKDMGVRFIDFI